MDRLRTPFFIAALIMMAVVVLIEIGDAAVLSRFTQPAAQVSDLRKDLSSDLKGEEAAQMKDALDKADPTQLTDLQSVKPPGKGIPYMGLLDGILLFLLGLMGASLVFPDSVVGRLQGCGTCLFSVLIILGGIGMIFLALALVILMVGLLLAFPFGTIAYFAIYGHFARGAAAAVLGVLMMLKFGVIICLLLAHQRFIQNKGLVLLIVTSLVAGIIVSFLHGLVPGFLVSITDAIAAIVVAIIAIIWAIILIIGAIPAILRALKPA